MNGVPLRRVNQAYVIATSTKVDIAAVKLPEIDDAYFAKEKVSSKKTKEEQFFAQSATVSLRFRYLLSAMASRPLLSLYTLYQFKTSIVL